MQNIIFLINNLSHEYERFPENSFGNKKSNRFCVQNFKSVNKTGKNIALFEFFNIYLSIPLD